MKTLFRFAWFVVATGLPAIVSASAAAAEQPLWAYGFLAPPAPGEKAKAPGPPSTGLAPGEDAHEHRRKRRIEGSRQSFSLREIGNPTEAVDWFPEDHSPMPPVVRHGPAGAGALSRACAYCHLPNGKGRPENAPVSGLPPAYFIRQLQDFRDGLRSSSDPRKGNTLVMIALAQAMTGAEMRAAADYFAVLPVTPWIRIVETDFVPKTKITGARMFSPISEELTEPIAGRVIEVPEDVEQVETLENPRVGFVAYVPVGSVRKGQTLVTTGGSSVVDGKSVPGKTVACITCHGPDLNGVAEIPGIAGRSPSYLVRQLYDIQQGTRKSPLSQTMLPVVINLTGGDFVAIAAFVSSLGAPK
jgi:cytochrome c553